MLSSLEQKAYNTSMSIKVYFSMIAAALIVILLWDRGISGEYGRGGLDEKSVASRGR